MKKTILIGFIILSTFFSKAQVIPIEKHSYYMDNQIEIPDGAYLKDINHVLDKFIGTWRGGNNDLQFEFKINKITRVSDLRSLKIDELLIRYKISDNSGNIIEDTTSLPDNSLYVIKGEYLDKDGYYVLYYQGKETVCGQNGDVFISVFGDQNEKMQLFLYPDGTMIDCTTTYAEQILPTSSMTLVKQ